MRERFTYEISTSTQDGQWKPAVIRDDTFSRDPESIARSLLEQWIIDHQGRLSGGRVFVFGGSHRETPDHIIATVRVRVYHGDLYTRESQPAAVAYLGHAKSDYPGYRNAGRGPGTGGPSARRLRGRPRLRMPRAHPGDQEIADLPSIRHLAATIRGRRFQSRSTTTREPAA
ncbi:hypothetical protein [Actinopolymorpha alba]|uniref:hypothetical protein n=1 Tax=Actinopolymorpha alba TaxID=533267 RepID=UPI0003771EEB|nr:hypothetical protein [Actinopolymorpha alba]